MDNVQILFGAGGIKKAYEESLKSGQLDIVCLADDYEKIIGDYFAKEYGPRLYGKVATREILPDKQENRDYAKTKDAGKNAVKFLKLSAPSQSDMMVGSDRAILVSYGQDSPLAVIITDPELVKSLKMQFEALWKSL